MTTQVSPKTVKLLAKFMRPLAEEGLMSVPEMQEILANLKHLAEKDELLPPIPPKLVDQSEAAEMLGVSYSNFKKLEREGKLPFPRKMLGSCVRYRNLDICRFIMASDGDGTGALDVEEDAVPEEATRGNKA